MGTVEYYDYPLDARTTLDMVPYAVHGL